MSTPRVPDALLRGFAWIHRATNSVVQIIVLAAVGILVVGPVFVGVVAALFWPYQFLPDIGWIRVLYNLGLVFVVFQAYRYGHQLLRTVGRVVLGIEQPLYPSR